jgi:hypothetical protein
MLENITVTGNTENEVKKKGRKPTQVNYFDVKEELAVVAFINAKTYEEKNKIYNESLLKPLDKMISSIIRRYKLYRRDMNFNEIHTDTHSFLMTKMDKFKPAKEKKAYSYFGTICKNYLMGQIIKDQKEFNRKISYEDISSSIENNENYSYEIDSDFFDTESIIKTFLLELENFMKTENLNPNEKKLGLALFDLFENYESIFIGSGNNKFNKNIVLLSLREMTNLNTKEIRSSIRKFRNLYFELVTKLIKQ